MKKILIILTLVFLSGCAIGIDQEAVNVQEAMEEKAINLCVQACESYEGDLTSGPCLDGDIVNDWACDVAHDPREDVDNLEENQCEKYRDGISTHFVEVDENCDLIIVS